MSYRDLRNFTETMQELGYPRLISMENFRTPNFPLVAEILVWLVKRFDSDVDIPLEIRNEEERVALIRSVAQLFVLKANLKLNTKKLYQADGYAVKELLKVTNLLHESLKTADVKNTEDDDGGPEVSFVATALRAHEFKGVSQLVGDIVSTGASLYESLGKEGELRELRNNRAARHLEMTQVEQAIKDSITMVDTEIENTQQSIDGMVSNESSLNSKIEKKKSDLERHNKRLQTLRKIRLETAVKLSLRPAFMEEFEKLEEELKELYNDYVVKCRNIAYLESVLEQSELAEQKRIDQKLAFTRKLVEDLKQDDGSEEVFSEAIEDNVQPVARPRKSSRKVPSTKETIEQELKGTKVFGSMTGGQNDSESLDDSDSDFLLDGDITEDDIEIDNQPVKDVSDDDF